MILSGSLYKSYVECNLRKLKENPPIKIKQLNRKLQVKSMNLYDFSLEMGRYLFHEKTTKNTVFRLF